MVGFERPAKRNQCHDEECRADSAAKNEAYKRKLQSAAMRVIKEDYRQKRREERRLIRRKKTEQERREREEIEMSGVGMMLRNLVNLVTDAQGIWRQGTYWTLSVRLQTWQFHHRPDIHTTPNPRKET